MRRNALAAILACLLFMFSGTVSAQLTKSEQKCVNLANKNAQKLASKQGKEISTCIKDGAKGKLTDANAPIESCLTSDTKGKVN